MNQYQLIALDMDGTLLNSELKVSQGNKEAIRRAAAAGKHVVISTGRCLSEMRDVICDLPEIRYIVCENGSCVYDLKYERDVHVDPVPREEVRFILDAVKGEKCVIQCFSDNQSYFNQKDTAFADACRVGNYRDVFRRGSVFDAKLFANYGQRPFQIEKINLYFENARDRARMTQTMSSRPLQLADSFGYMLEIVSDLADKSRGLEKLCAKLGITMRQIITMGDSMNDVGMLRAAGFSAAMGNACAAAKEAATIVTADCDHDGVAKVIDEVLLGGGA